ncbi:Uncharacterized protein BM_BM8912 [Brugia malayi]|uniref:Uncharacterized protein n=1 Tax=Brugia malayi TaxID=6279 RepID=A0A4E9F1M4_BRUMA|nr:Uncharacterized protein BM_BM8912 [Brugia malayi]VIO88400.1 Uncharacterized protein BM_BM8912 [Brugia malayi]
MAKILSTVFLLFFITSNINGLPLDHEWKPKLSAERVKYIGNSLRPGRPLKRSSYADFTDFHPMDFNMIGDEMVVEFVPKYDIWQLYRPKRILDIRR